MLDKNSKKHLISYLCFLGIIVLMTAILVFFIIISRDSWKKGFPSEMQVVLDSYSSGTYLVGKYVDVKSTMSVSSAVYSLRDGKSGLNTKDYGVIIRIPSILGPVPAVFVCDENYKVAFAGYAGDLGKAKCAADLKISGGIISYWEKQVSIMMYKTIEGSR